MTHSDGSDNNGFNENPPTILLPYQEWIESAYRHVVIDALKYATKNKLPGNHSFYITYNTSYPGVSIPNHLKAKYPHEITIVLQHQFWDLIVNEQHKTISVGLSFGGIASTLIIPFGAITAFSDPEAKLLLTFKIIPPTVTSVDTVTSINNTKETETTPVKEDLEAQKASTTNEESQVISLDAFRKKHD